ncbi:septation regulator SpoVG [bacterium]|nr:septation regulator SpoVG [bacterium]
MEITEVRLTLRGEERLKAFVSITFDDAFVVRGLKVIDGNTGLFVAMPSRRRKDGEFRDIAHPINNATRQMIEDAVMGEYRRQLEAGMEPVREDVDHLGDKALVLAEGYGK